MWVVFVLALAAAGVGGAAFVLTMLAGDFLAMCGWVAFTGSCLFMCVRSAQLARESL
jgi:hypothetical protein